MNIYNIWCNLIDSHKDKEFCDAVKNYLNYFKKKKLVKNFRITRRKLGFGPTELGEFNIQIETKDMRELETIWEEVAKKNETVNKLHKEVYSRVKDFKSALYRDFPDKF